MKHAESKMVNADRFYFQPIGGLTSLEFETG